MKLRVYSDLHLDHYNSASSLWYPPELPDDQDTILVIAGDLWVGTKWIKFGEFSWIANVAPRFKQVLIVLGNHCYWPCKPDLSILYGGEKCNSMLQELGLTNVKVLDCSTWEHEDVIFVGATLWTDMNKADPLTMHQMNFVMAYDGKISYDTGPNGQWSRFTEEKWLTTHRKHKRYIELVASQNPDKRIIVITHHIPLTNLGDPRYLPCFENGYYASDLSDLILDNPNIKLWGYGHTHYQNQYQLGECTLINNCVGYKSENNEQKGKVKHEVIVL